MGEVQEYYKDKEGRLSYTQLQFLYKTNMMGRKTVMYARGIKRDGKKRDMMEETEQMSIAIATIWDRMKQEEPMVHCMTHAITMNDSANAILVVGASPIMASHPREVEEVVSHSDSLVVNLGNITDVRMEAMMKAGKRAWSLQIPTLIDVVGIGTSTLRYDFAKAFIDACHPGIIKGNSSEIRRLMGLPSHAKGVDSSREDQVTVETIAQLAGPCGTLQRVWMLSS